LIGPSITIGAVILLCRSAVSSALAQGDPRRHDDPIIIPKDKTEIQYRKPEDIPRQLRAAIGERCNYKSRLADLPIRIVRPDTNGQLIALVYRLKRFGYPDQPWISYWETPKWNDLK
jgi:hypothetical protein